MQKQSKKLHKELLNLWWLSACVLVVTWGYYSLLFRLFHKLRERTYSLACWLIQHHWKNYLYTGITYWILLSVIGFKWNILQSPHLWQHSWKQLPVVFSLQVVNKVKVAGLHDKGTINGCIPIVHTYSIICAPWLFILKIIAGFPVFISFIIALMHALAISEWFYSWLN